MSEERIRGRGGGEVLNDEDGMRVRWRRGVSDVAPPGSGSSLVARVTTDGFNKQGAALGDR